MRKRNRWLALGTAASVKALFLFGTSQLFVAGHLQLQVGDKAQIVVMNDAFLTMMSWPQLGTALAGGITAFGVLRMVNWNSWFK